MEFMELDNKIIGKNIAKFRKLRDVKASEVAEKLGLSEAAYTKYERGESSITIDIIQKVSETLNVDPFQILSLTPKNFVDNITNSSVAVDFKQENSTYQTINEEQTRLMLRLLETVISLNEKLVATLDKNKA